MQWIAEHAEIIKKVAEDFIVAGSGAFAGAYAAQLIVEKSTTRKELAKEMRNANACIALAFGICNSLLALKKQHVKRLKDNYTADREQFFAHLSQNNAPTSGRPPFVFQFTADLQTLYLPYQPIEVLQENVFNNLTVKGRPLNLTVSLSGIVQDLKASLTMRNELIAKYRSAGLSQNELIMYYFGVPDPNGHVDMNYPSSIDAIYFQTDSGIYFSQLLCKDLVKYGKELSAYFKKKYKKEILIDEPDFTPAIIAGLMPSDDDFASWSSSFVERPKPLTRWQKLIKWCRSIFNRLFRNSY